MACMYSRLFLDELADGAVATGIADDGVVGTGTEVADGNVDRTVEHRSCTSGHTLASHVDDAYTDITVGS